MCSANGQIMLAPLRYTPSEEGFADQKRCEAKVDSFTVVRGWVTARSRVKWMKDLLVDG